MTTIPLPRSLLCQPQVPCRIGRLLSRRYKGTINLPFPIGKSGLSHLSSSHPWRSFRRRTRVSSVPRTSQMVWTTLPRLIQSHRRIRSPEMRNPTSMRKLDPLRLSWQLDVHRRQGQPALFDLPPPLLPVETHEQLLVQRQNRSNRKSPP